MNNEVQEQTTEIFPRLVDRVIVLTGPTASGKSEVAVEFARLIGGEILSLDSIAVYQEMNVGTAKPSHDFRSRVPHHLIDLLPPNEDFSVARYLQLAHRLVDQLEGKGKPAIFVGGTPMYLKAVLRGFDSGPPADETFRQSVELDVAKHGSRALHKRLEQVDPLSAHRIDPNDTRRMIRALEVFHQTGQPLSHRQLQFDEVKPASQCNVFCMSWDRKVLHRRINQRVDKMFEDGLIQEVQGLMDRYGTLSKTAAQAVGYRELIECINGELGLSKAKEEIAAHTRQMARRQETWFRSFQEVRSINVSDPLDSQRIAKQLVELVTYS